VEVTLPPPPPPSPTELGVGRCGEGVSVTVGEKKEGVFEEDTVGVARKGESEGEREVKAVTETNSGEVEGLVVTLGAIPLKVREGELEGVTRGETESVGVRVIGGVAVRDAGGELEAVPAARPANHTVMVMDREVVEEEDTMAEGVLEPKELLVREGLTDGEREGRGD